MKELKGTVNGAFSEEAGYDAPDWPMWPVYILMLGS